MDSTLGGNLADRVRRIIDDNAYMVLGTADDSGRPWTSPVFYAAHECRVFYWISSPDVTHSRNIADRPEISIVIFDSRAPVGSGGERAVYMTATAVQVPSDDLDRALAVAPSFARHGEDDITPAEVRPPSLDRLYRAMVTEHTVACPRSAGEPCADHRFNYDHRTPVRLA